MYLEIFLADFTVCRAFLGISRHFAEIPEFRGSVTARNIRSPVMIIHKEKQQQNSISCLSTPFTHYSLNVSEISYIFVLV